MIKPVTFLTEKQIHQMLKQKKRVQNEISPELKSLKSYSNLFLKQKKIQIAHNNSITPIPIALHIQEKPPQIKKKQQNKQSISKRNHVQRHSIGGRPKIFLERFLKQKMLLMKKISEQRLEFKQKLQKQKKEEANKIENLRKMIHEQKRLKKQLEKIKYASSHYQTSILTQNTTAENIHLNQSISFLSDKENKKYMPSSLTTTTNYDQNQIRYDKKSQNKLFLRQSIQEQINNLNTQQNINEQLKEKASIYTNNNTQTTREKKIVKIKFPGMQKFNNTQVIKTPKQSKQNQFERNLYNTYSKKTSKFHSKTNFDETQNSNNDSPLKTLTRRFSKKLFLSHDEQQNSKHLQAQIRMKNSQTLDEQKKKINSIKSSTQSQQKINLVQQKNTNNNSHSSINKQTKKPINNFYYKSPIFQILFKQKLSELSNESINKVLEKKLKFDENKEMKQNRQLIKNHQTRNNDIKRVIEAFDYHLMLIDEKKYDISTKLDFNIQMLQIDEYNFDFIQTLDFKQKIQFEFPEKQNKTKLKYGYTIYCEKQRKNTRRKLQQETEQELNQRLNQTLPAQNWEEQILLQHGLQQTSKCSSFYHVSIKNRNHVKQVFINK